MQELITAREARNKSMLNDADFYEKQLERIIKSINMAISKGYFDILFHEDFHPRVKEMLINKGYIIKVEHFRDDEHYSISW